MDSIFKQLRDEHEEILRKTDYLQGLCLRLMEENQIDFAAFREVIVFIREYADRLHHKKEEQILFREMVAQLGPVAANMIQHGMLVEHDLGRLHVFELEQGLNAYEQAGDPVEKLRILANAMGYCYLIRRHIDKENNAVFTFAEKNLPEETIRAMNEETAAF